VHHLVIHFSVRQAQINRVCSQMSITTRKLLSWASVLGPLLFLIDSISNLYRCHRVQQQAVFGWSQIMSRPGLSSKCGDLPVILQIFSQSCEKLSDAPNTLNFSLYTLNGTELLHNLQHCSHALMYTIHTALHTCCS